MNQNGQSSRPINHISLGSVSASIWETTENGYPKYSVRFEKSWQNDQGVWQRTDYMTPLDIPFLSAVSQAVTQWILDRKEQLRRMNQRQSSPQYGPAPASQASYAPPAPAPAPATAPVDPQPSAGKGKITRGRVKTPAPAPAPVDPQDDPNYFPDESKAWPARGDN